MQSTARNWFAWRRRRQAWRRLKSWAASCVGSYTHWQIKMVLPTLARMRAPLGVAMRIQRIALQQRMLRLGKAEVRWEDLPGSVQKEVIALLSQLIREHARIAVGTEQKEAA